MDEVAGFLSLSVILTGCREYDLRGTGLVNEYVNVVISAVGRSVWTDLLAAGRAVVDEAAGDPEKLKDWMRLRILADQCLGPVARNVIKLWYLGAWWQLPDEWRERFGAHEADITHVISSESYCQGLLWGTIGANSPGASPQGFGSWAKAPSFDVPGLRLADGRAR
jgi:hypothetical protein